MNLVEYICHRAQSRTVARDGIWLEPKLMRVRLLVVTLVVVAAVLVLALLVIPRDGLSTRGKPSMAERIIARAARQLAVPSAGRDAINPIAFSPEAFAEARAHFADHCASCHGNDGGGDTELGRHLYPQAPDMRLATTQGLSDGELYWIIENGVRLTGMPAWGDGTGHDADTWKLVHFIRHLNDLTAEQLKEMAALNPRSPAELEEERQDQDFLEGKDPGAPSPIPSHHQHKE
jgi:mono/diheme cytochrome c family protein